MRADGLEIAEAALGSGEGGVLSGRVGLISSHRGHPARLGMSGTPWGWTNGDSPPFRRFPAKDGE